VLAIAVPDFGDFLSLIGGLGGTMLAFVIPLVIHLIVFRKKLTWLAVVKDIAIILFGLVAVVVTTIQSVQNIVEGIKKKYH
jgi:proton-coupled amino acid transporter